MFPGIWWLGNDECYYFVNVEVNKDVNNILESLKQPS